MTDWELWADAIHGMLRAGSELSVHINWISGAKPIREMNRPTHRVLERGDMVENELESSWGGYRCQGVHPLSIGDPDPVYPELIKVQGELYEELLADVKPGTPMGAIAEKCVKRAPEIAPKTGPAAGATAVLSMHGRGAGDDGPIITGGTSREARNFSIPLQENMVFIFKPTVRSATGGYFLQWGDSVVVTKDGGRRLGYLPHGILRAEA
jgi:Xaa-Pro aminopeptidase